MNSWYPKFELLISTIAFWISRIRILDINNCILDIKNSHFWYQQLHFGYQQFAFWISTIAFWISTIRILDIKNGILDINNSNSWYQELNSGYQQCMLMTIMWAGVGRLRKFCLHRRNIFYAKSVAHCGHCRLCNPLAFGLVQHWFWKWIKLDVLRPPKT